MLYVAVPILRDGRARYVLRAGIEPASMTGWLFSGGLPAAQSAVLVDRKKVIVARSDGEQVLGKPATSELARRSDASVKGSFTDVSLEGVPVHAGFHRSGVSGWTVATSMPMALVNGPLWRRLGLLLVVGAVLIGLGMAGASWFERRVRAPIVALSSAAAALARGGPVQSLPSSSIAEIDSLSQSIAHADRLLREREQGWRQAEAELADQREQFRVTLASIGDGVIATDESGRVTFMNDVARTLTGWVNEPAVGQPFDSVLALLDEETREPDRRALRPGDARRHRRGRRATDPPPVSGRRRDARGMPGRAPARCGGAHDRDRARLPRCVGAAASGARAGGDSRAGARRERRGGVRQSVQGRVPRDARARAAQPARGDQQCPVRARAGRRRRRHPRFRRVR